MTFDRISSLSEAWHSAVWRSLERRRRAPERAHLKVRERGAQPPTQPAAVRPSNAVAERVGFEPTKSFDSALFKSAAINRSATSPAVRIPAPIEVPSPPDPAKDSRGGPQTGYPRATRRNSAHHLGG